MIHTALSSQLDQLGSCELGQLSPQLGLHFLDSSNGLSYVSQLPGQQSHFLRLHGIHLTRIDVVEGKGDGEAKIHAIVGRSDGNGAIGHIAFRNGAGNGTGSVELIGNSQDVFAIRAEADAEIGRRDEVQTKDGNLEIVRRIYKISVL